MKKFLSVFLVLALGLGAPGDVSAALDDKLKEVFDSFSAVNVGNPAVYENQGQGYLVGGSLSYRMIPAPIPLLSFSAPRLSAGCGGIDIYLGSFSYGSLSRYVDMLTQLGTGVVLGFAFQLAIKFLCEPCADVLNKLESAARMVNQLGQVGPCESAQAIANTVNSFEAVATSVDEAWTAAEQKWGTASDEISNRDSHVVKDAGDAITDMATNALADATDDPRGNMVWHMLMKKGVSVDDARLIMSAIGTVVVDDIGIVQPHFPVLNMTDLVAVQLGQAMTMYDCADGYGADQCLDVIEVSTVTTVKGFQQRVEEVLDGVLTNIYTGVALTPAQEAFIAIVPQPVFAMLVQIPSPRSLAESYIERSSSVTAYGMADFWLHWVVREVVGDVFEIYHSKPGWHGGPVVEEWQASVRDTLQQAKMDHLIALQTYNGFFESGPNALKVLGKNQSAISVTGK